MHTTAWLPEAAVCRRLSVQGVAEQESNNSAIMYEAAQWSAQESLFPQ